MMNISFLFGNDSLYIHRQNTYADSTLTQNNGKKITLKAFKGIPIDSLELEEILSDLSIKLNPDFEIVELVRVLFYSNGIYDNEILPVLEEIPFWLNANDSIRNYWTENHMIMWMSSEWLLHERYNWEVNDALYQRLVHYLETKVEYGFYEFFSSVYAPYTLSGLLNLYEFTEDPKLKNLSMQVSKRLLKDLLKPTTDLGVFFPAAGRNYPGKYKTAYGQNHSSLIYLLTGFGEIPSVSTHAGAFLATSSLPVDEVINSWSPKLDTEVYVGHSLERSFEIHKNLSFEDQIIFQWSSSAYAHPLNIENSFQLLSDSNLWQHNDWDALRPLSFVAPKDAPKLAEDLSILSYSSIISGYNVRIFKNNSIALMSISNLWKGKLGYQQWPFAATVGKTAVYTQSGEVKLDWDDRDKSIENTHMPHVEQNSNLALIMYRPEPLPELLSTFAEDMFANRDVSLYWEDDAYDEIVEKGNWLLGRQDQNFVAVRRACTGKINSWNACKNEKGQTWAIMLGDVSLYQSFENFQNIIEQSEFQEEWYYDPVTAQSVYYASIEIDTFSLEYTWGIDSANNILKTSKPFSLYPNPTKNKLTIDFNSVINQTTDISIYNTLGKEIYYKKIEDFPTHAITIEIAEWPKGTYTIVLENEKNYNFQKLIKL